MGTVDLYEEFVHEEQMKSSSERLTDFMQGAKDQTDELQSLLDHLEGDDEFLPLLLDLALSKDSVDPMVKQLQDIVREASIGAMEFCS